MEAQTDMTGLRAAWRALAGNDSTEGWRTITISSFEHCMLLAGRHSPRDEEAVLISFRNVKTIPDPVLPQGRGFEVTRLLEDPSGRGMCCLGLSRREGASLDMFAMMAEDLVGLVKETQFETENRLLQLFLSRILAWQDFMERNRDGVLSAEAESGLFGELVVLEQLLDAGVTPAEAIQAWQGPVGSPQDYIFGPGAIEVKTTLSTGWFPATISSLEQLDETLRQPLFVAAIRLELRASGMTLPELADSLCARLGPEPGVRESYRTKLVLAGLPDGNVEKYTRHFTHSSTNVHRVEGDFPRLTRRNVHPALTKARYEIDLDLAGTGRISLLQALELLGVI